MNGYLVMVFPVVLFDVIRSGSNSLIYESEIFKCGQMKTTEQYFPVVLFIILYKIVLTFDL